MISTGEKIKALRKKRGLTLEAVGAAVGVGKSTVRKWETGQIANMRSDKIAALAAVLGTTPDDLIGQGNSPYFNNVYHIDLKKFPLLRESLNGKPILINDEYDALGILGIDLDADFCIKVADDSMVGAGIYKGDVVFVRKQSSVKNWEIAVVLIGNEIVLKRVKINDGDISLYAENPMYKTLRYAGDQLNQVRILGKAIVCQSDVK